MRTLMSLKLHDAGPGRRAVLEFFRPRVSKSPDPQSRHRARHGGFPGRPKSEIVGVNRSGPLCSTHSGSNLRLRPSGKHDVKDTAQLPAILLKFDG